MKVVFFGSSKFVLPILEVVRKNFDLALVVTTENPVSASKGLALQGCPVIAYSITHHIPYLSVKQFNNETIEQLNNVQAELAILAYFGLILPKEVLNVFSKGILNIHPSLLPTYRGPTPGQTAILNGDKKTGVTFIKLDEQVDHGPILVQIEEPILPTDTAETLYERLFAIGAKLLSQTINKYIKEEIKLSPQDHIRATFTKHLTRQDGFIDINNPPSKEVIDRMIRAYYPWPGVWGKWKMSAKGGSASGGENGKWKIVKFLPEQKIQVEGGRPMTYQDFVNGYPQARQLLERLGLWEG